MTNSITSQGPQFEAGEDLATWAVETRLPWLVETLGLTAGAICGSVPEPVRRQVLGLGVDAPLPVAIDWSHNGIIISPPGTGKGMAVFVEALAHFQRVFVLVPSVIQAHKLEESLDVLYTPEVGGCMTSQRKAPGLISVITTGIFHQMVKDPTSDLWKEGAVLCVDEAQRILEQDPQTEFMIAHAAHRGVRTMIVSATIAPGTLPRVFGSDTDGKALVYQLSNQMHPVEMHSIEARRGQEMSVLAKTEALTEAGKTTLVFAPTIKGVMDTVNALRQLRKEGKVDSYAVPVTGAHVTEDQLEQIRRAQKTGKPVVVVATPGTMDSSVTIPGLSLVVILDHRVRVDWNEFGVRTRWGEQLPMNHIWQMIRRVGRQERTDGKKDQVWVLGSARTDVLSETPKFSPIVGCSKHTPVEDLLLAAAFLDVPFKDVQKYMVSTFSDDHIEKAVTRLLEVELLVRTDNPNDNDGYELTKKGHAVIRLPYEYQWSQMIVDAPAEMQAQLALVASFPRLRSLEMYEKAGAARKRSGGSMSDFLLKLELGIEYIDTRHDHKQFQLAKDESLSFRRLEQMETLFELGCKALGIQFQAPSFPAGHAQEEFLEYVVRKGLYVGLFFVYFLGKTKHGWQDECKTPDGAMRTHMADADRMAFSGHAIDKVTTVVATPMWFTNARGFPMSNLDNTTIVPRHMVAELVEEKSSEESWFQLTFEEGEHRGEIQYCAVQGGEKYVVSRHDASPSIGVPYWCSIDRKLTPWVTSVIVHHSVQVQE